MRIRKNAMLSSLYNPSVEDHRLQPLVCQLNQSPWDVISLLPNSFCSPYQFEREASPTGTWSSLNCPAPSLESCLAVDKRVAFIEGDDRKENNVKKEKITTKKKRRKQGVTGEYQLARCSSAVFEGNNDNAVRSKGLNRRARKKTGGSSQHEFYYYSGFGPSWGKRRGEQITSNVSKEEGQYRNLSPAKDDKSIPIAHTTPCSELGQTLYEDSKLDVFYEGQFHDDDDDVEEFGGGKPRIRKPVKARSLKSLM